MEINLFTYLKDYEVNRKTMSILPVTIKNRKFSKVMETDGEYLVAMKPTDIVERSCRYFGSSLKGRQEGTRELMGVTHKAPIIVEATSMIYLFPTASPTKSDCAWISHSYVVKHSSDGSEKTVVTFSNDKSILLPISEGSFENQLYRTSHLRTIMSTRIDQREHRKQFVLSPPNYPQHKSIVNDM
ncbi:competence protein ComK [Cytobacillus suaedae]|nr:competence protein ComK [Cytobacillus suaedae]